MHVKIDTNTWLSGELLYSLYFVCLCGRGANTYSFSIQTINRALCWTTKTENIYVSWRTPAIETKGIGKKRKEPVTHSNALAHLRFDGRTALVRHTVSVLSSLIATRSFRYTHWERMKRKKTKTIHAHTHTQTKARARTYRHTRLVCMMFISHMVCRVHRLC